jgi:hypothetical protein
MGKEEEEGGGGETLALTTISLVFIFPFYYTVS